MASLGVVKRGNGYHHRSQQTGKVFCWKVLDLAHLLFFMYAHKLCMNNIIEMLLLDSCMSSNNQLLYFSSFSAGLTSKIANKNCNK